MSKIGRSMVLLAGSFLLCCFDGAFAQTLDWPMFGQNTGNTGSNSSKTSKSSSNAARLIQKWTFTTSGDVTARAAVVDGVAYFPDWGGNVTAVDASTGIQKWSHPLSGPTGWLLAIDAKTGSLVWKVQPDTSNPFPVITGSSAVANGIVYVSMTSNEEFAAGLDPSYNCCSASGSVVAVSAATGANLWQTFTVPPGYSGGAVWGSNPVVDAARGTVFVGTGNNYSHPTDPSYVACVSKGTGNGNDNWNGKTEAHCLSSDDHADSILALDMYTGAIKWATRLMNWDQPYVAGSDDWNTSCIFGPTPQQPGPNCPAPLPTAANPNQPTGPDFDFGSAPKEITYQTRKGPKTIIGAGQKSGIYYALDPDKGKVLWTTQVGPGSSLGGIEWGSATDGTRIYVAIANLYGIPYGAGSAGSWAALDPATGAILWQKADPNGAIDIGPMSVANGVVYAGSMGGASSTSAQTMFALDAANGNTLWSFAPGSSVNAGATIVNGVVYWGSGYRHLGPLGTGNNQLFAFSLPGY